MKFRLHFICSTSIERFSNRLECRRISFNSPATDFTTHVFVRLRFVFVFFLSFARDRIRLQTKKFAWGVCAQCFYIVVCRNNKKNATHSFNTFNDCMCATSFGFLFLACLGHSHFFFISAPDTINEPNASDRIDVMSSHCSTFRV